MRNLFQTQLVMTVFSTQRDDTYNAVKKLTCSEKPVASQCVLSRTLGKPQKLKRIALNIGLQMVAKLGGQLWEVNIPPKLVRKISQIINKKRLSFFPRNPTSS